MVTIRFKCPTCLRKTLSANASVAATEIIRRTCPKCKARWQFKVEPISGRPGIAIHVVTNTARLASDESTCRECGDPVRRGNDGFGTESAACVAHGSLYGA